MQRNHFLYVFIIFDTEYKRQILLFFSYIPNLICMYNSYKFDKPSNLTSFIFINLRRVHPLPLFFTN